MAADADHGAKRAAGRICMLGLVAEVDARMGSLWLGDGVSGRIFSGDDIYFSLRMIELNCSSDAGFA